MRKPLNRSQRGRFCLFAICVGLLAAAPAPAQDPDFDPVSFVGGRVGYIELEDVDDDGSFNFGVVAGVLLRAGFAFEGSLDFQETDILLAVSGVNVTLDTVRRETYALQGGLSFTPFTRYRVRPFAIGGVGYYLSEYSADVFDDETVDESGFFGGVGIDFMGDHWKDGVSLTVESRWLFTEREEVAGAGVKADGRTYSLGFRYRF